MQDIFFSRHSFDHQKNFISEPTKVLITKKILFLSPPKLWSLKKFYFFAHQSHYYYKKVLFLQSKKNILS